MKEDTMVCIPLYWLQGLSSAVKPVLNIQFIYEVKWSKKGQVTEVS